MRRAALAMDVSPIGGPIPFIVTDQHDNLKLFLSEASAEAYVKKNFANCVKFIGTIMDPTQLHKTLQKEYLKESKND